jgi:hypothetical protein
MTSSKVFTGIRPRSAPASCIEAVLVHAAEPTGILDVRPVVLLVVSIEQMRQLRELHVDRIDYFGISVSGHIGVLNW